jgi:uncharacterized protein DUF4383
MGLLLGLFYVNWLHSLTHLLIGVAGLATYRSLSAAKAYTLAIGVAYAVLFVLGLIFGVTFLGGLLPLNGWDNDPAPADRAGSVQSLPRLARDSGDDHRLAVEKRRGSLVQRLPLKIQKPGVLSRQEKISLSVMDAGHHTFSAGVPLALTGWGS